MFSTLSYRIGLIRCCLTEILEYAFASFSAAFDRQFISFSIFRHLQVEGENKLMQRRGCFPICGLCVFICFLKGMVDRTRKRFSANVSSSQGT